VTGTSFQVTPGTYLLIKNGASSQFTGSEKFGNILLNEFVAPAATVDRTLVLHDPSHEAMAHNDYVVKATVVSKEQPAKVELYLQAGRRLDKIEMRRIRGYVYEGIIPASKVNPGYLRYYIGVDEKDQTLVFPGGNVSRPDSWDFFSDHPYQTSVIAGKARLFLFNAYDDTEELSRPWRAGANLVPTGEPHRAYVVVNVDKLFVPDPENQGGEQISDYAMRYHFGKKINGRNDDLSSATKIVVRGRSLNGKPCKVQVALITKDGTARGGVVTIQPDRENYSIDIQRLDPVKLTILPRPYPTFLPYFFEQQAGLFDLERVDVLQISIGPGMSESEKQQAYQIGVESVWLE
jgi:hypothetical protein